MEWYAITAVAVLLIGMGIITYDLWNSDRK